MPPCDCPPGECRAPSGIGKVCRRGVAVQIHGSLPFERPHRVATRPRDWAEPARSIIFTEAEIQRDARRRMRA